MVGSLSVSSPPRQAWSRESPANFKIHLPGLLSQPLFSRPLQVLNLCSEGALSESHTKVSPWAAPRDPVQAGGLQRPGLCLLPGWQVPLEIKASGAPLMKRKFLSLSLAPSPPAPFRFLSGFPCLQVPPSAHTLRGILEVGPWEPQGSAGRYCWGHRGTFLSLSLHSA